MRNESLNCPERLICYAPCQRICIIRCNQTQTKINQQKFNSLQKPKHICLSGEAGHAISKFCAARSLKLRQLISLLSLREHTVIERYQINGTLGMTKHVRNGENVIVCRNRNKILCVVRQVMQSANWAPTRRLKNVLVGQLGMLLCIK